MIPVAGFSKFPSGINQKTTDFCWKILKNSRISKQEHDTPYPAVGYASLPAGSFWKRTKPIAGSGHRISASMSLPFPEFSSRNWSVLGVLLYL
jgi:hypothetical protein